MESGENQLQIGRLPDLRIVELDRLRFHEEHNEERMLNLAQRICAEGMLKNPPVAASVKGEEGYVLLDGANRVTALARLGIRHVPVQVIELSDPNLVLSSWHHCVERYGRRLFLDELTGRRGLQITAAEGGVADGELLCLMRFRNEEPLYVYNSADRAAKISNLKFITGLYINTPHSDRVSYTDIDHLLTHYPDFQTLIIFTEFSKEEIRATAGDGNKLPSGLTRVILPKRALGLNVGLEILRSSKMSSEKNRWLEEMIQRKVAEKSIRFYQEQTFLFNE